MRTESVQTAPICPNCVRLAAELDEALARIAELERSLAEFTTLVQKQSERIGELEREAGRQAAPFRREDAQRQPGEEAFPEPQAAGTQDGPPSVAPQAASGR